ncbi:MAG: 1-deoxy-D-xylulose-5-phosphate reductoisomerase [Actinobacteria bacterium]|nr:MAG: 1-deoxy-D-xylulose-5-phosphate reductoisomerase [Actinomycetota bacterium]
MSRVRLAILGSTGSIGRQALDVAARFPDRIEVVALAANSNAGLLAEQAAAFAVAHTALASADGPEAVVRLAALEGVDVVLNALVGAAGLRATIAALTSGRRLALANKESLVVGGELVMRLAAPGALLPVDSEHSAIFQCLAGEDPGEVARIWLTASGGPFRGMTREQLAEVTPEQALRHPRWSMGPKITIDSATLMNKGLEAIEAHHLFGVGYDRITVVVHPQSCVHSMVEFADGSVKAHLGATDMRVPIQYALSYPERWEAPVPPVDFTQAGSLEFGAPESDTFRCLALALEAGRAGGTVPAAMNAANEVAVAAFLAGRCRLTDIDRVVEGVVGGTSREDLESVEQVEAVDADARARAVALLGS